MLEFVKKDDELSLIHQHQHKSIENPSNNSMSMAGAAMMSNSSGGGGKSANYHVCQSCKLQITSRWLFKMFSCSEDTFFHEECLTCSVCNIQLNTTCFYRNEKLYCRFDYNRIFGGSEQRGMISKSCSKCGELIQTNELVMKVEKAHVYHLHCFSCTICCTQLQKGDEFVLRGSQLFCRADYEKEQQQLFLYQSQQLSPRGDENNRPRDGRRGPKRPRTILTSTQRRQFKASFEVSPKPCRKVREGLAKETGLSVRVVQVWFQNQRAKMKKIQRKSGNTKGEDGSGSCKENKDGKRKRGGDDDSCSSDEDDDEEAARSCYDTDSQHGPFTPGGGNCPIIPPRNPNLPYSPDDYNSNDESFICSSEISFEEDSSNTGLEPGAEHAAQMAAGGGVIELHNLTSSRGSSAGQDLNSAGMYHHGHHGHGHHGHGHGHLVPLPPQAAVTSSYAAGPGQGQQQPPAINPIDKLYLMQNSYFNNANNE